MMWEKKESESQRGSQQASTGRTDSFAPSPVPAAAPSRGRAANIGGSLFIKGEVTGSEDLTVEGRVEGKIDLKDHNISIAQSGRVTAEIHAKSVTILGEVNGNVHADEKIEIAETGKLTGDLYAPRVAISDGAQFKGSVEMGKTQSAPTSVRERPQAQVAAQGKMAG